MFRRGLIFLLFLCLGAVIWVQSQELFLYFYVLFPALLFPLFYFYERGERLFFMISSVLGLAFYLFYLIPNLSLEMTLLGIGFVGVFGILAYYQTQWSLGLRLATELDEKAFTELEDLSAKYDSRLESLGHLENQVSGLLELFEIARDFGDCLSFEALSDEIIKNNRSPRS